MKARAAALRKYFWSGEEKLKTNLLSFPSASFASVAVMVCDRLCLNSTAWIRCTWPSRQSDKWHVSREDSKHIKWHSYHGRGFCKDRWPQQSLSGAFLTELSIYLKCNYSKFQSFWKKPHLSKSVQVCMQLTYLAHLFCLLSYIKLFYVFKVKNRLQYLLNAQELKM